MQTCKKLAMTSSDGQLGARKTLVMQIDKNPIMQMFFIDFKSKTKSLRVLLDRQWGWEIFSTTVSSMEVP